MIDPTSFGSRTGRGRRTGRSRRAAAEGSWPWSFRFRSGRSTAMRSSPCASSSACWADTTDSSWRRRTSPCRKSDIGVKRVPSRFFGSAAAHGALLVSGLFYDAFAEYEFILIHHLDAFVFSDQLGEWCARGFDYIGTPWFTYDTDPPSPRFAGTGGFSLRRIAACRAVLHSRARGVEPAEFWRRTRAARGPVHTAKALAGTVLKYVPAFNSVRWETRRLPRDQDGRGQLLGRTSAALLSAFPSRHGRGSAAVRLGARASPLLRPDGRSPAVRLSRLVPPRKSGILAADSSRA